MFALHKALPKCAVLVKLHDSCPCRRHFGNACLVAATSAFHLEWQLEWLKWTGLEGIENISDENWWVQPLLESTSTLDYCGFSSEKLAEQSWNLWTPEKLPDLRIKRWRASREELMQTHCFLSGAHEHCALPALKATEIHSGHWKTPRMAKRQHDVARSNKSRLLQANSSFSHTSCLFLHWA